MLDVTSNMDVSFPLFCRTSLSELQEKWMIRGECGIKIPAWPARVARALLSLDMLTKSTEFKYKRWCTEDPHLSRFCASRLLFIRIRIIINPCASRCRSFAHSPLIFPRRARKNTQEVACALSCNSATVLPREGFVRESNVYETSCTRRATEE